MYSLLAPIFDIYLRLFWYYMLCFLIYAYYVLIILPIGLGELVAEVILSSGDKRWLMSHL
jgi:hypothetical protein